MEVKRRTARCLVKRLKSDSDQIRTEAICELRLLSKHDPESRLFVSEAGAIPLLSQSLYISSSDHHTSPNIQENAVAALLNLSISSRELLMSTPGLLDSLSHVLRYPSSPASFQAAAATVYSLLVVDHYRPIIGSKLSILSPLIDLLRSPNSPPRSIKDSLKALFAISLYPLNRPRLVDLGVVPPLFSLVVKDSRLGFIEDSTAIIAQLAGCYESIDAFRKVSGVSVLVDLLDVATGSSTRARENAASALLNLVQCGGEKVAGDIREMGSAALAGISELAETGSSRAKSKAEALMSILFSGSCTERHHQEFGVLNSSSSSSY
ncbi:U-box domain-containing protein 4 [Magnolia sinica]|uniref:U-box domain-containing protein 4 n=1 Tax=Magnolia sinica TaxID=86752 RepID=UPI00265912AA|nr:U-box domain-containing protein 4 [Magnolia sinica]